MTTETLDTTQLARAAHRYLEPLHTLVYFVPENGERYATLGIKGGMRGYFASRSAPFGQVPAEVVIATFYNFSPAHVRKAIPSVWDVTSPAAVLEARLDGADAALRRLLPDDVDTDEMRRAAELAREATSALDVVGRPLYAAHAALPWPQPAHLQLWHAATLLREHRGDGHIAALVLDGLTGLEAAVTYCATGKGMPEDMAKATRGYSDDEWLAAQDGLRGRGLLDEQGQLTEAGREQRERLEAATDAAAVAPYEHLGPERTQELIDLCRPWARSVSKQIFG
jgi:helix-turn-helix protein